MKILEYIVYGVLAIVGLFGLSLVCVLIDDLLFGEARSKKKQKQMFQDMLTGKFQSSSKRPGHLPGKRIIGALMVCCAMFFGPSKAFARQIDTIIVHHTAGADVSVATIDKWHQARGWKGIGYHFLIRADGTIERGRAIEKTGAHAKGRNAHSIGIALTGKDQFTLSQKMALADLIKNLCRKYPIKSIERHHEKCPGPGLTVEPMAKYILEIYARKEVKSGQTKIK